MKKQSQKSLQHDLNPWSFDWELFTLPLSNSHCLLTSSTTQSYTNTDTTFISAQDPSEVTLKGNEYLSYNLFEKSGEAILSIQDEVSLFFRTNRPEGLLFYTGDPLSFPDKQWEEKK